MFQEIIKIKDWPYYRFLAGISGLWSWEKTIFTKKWEDRMMMLN